MIRMWCDSLLSKPDMGGRGLSLFRRETGQQAVKQRPESVESPPDAARPRFPAPPDLTKAAALLMNPALSGVKTAENLENRKS
jgi:hypothetical protein